MKSLRLAVPALVAGLLAASTCPTSDKLMVQEIIVEPNPFTVAVGQTIALSDTLKDASGHVLAGHAVAWSSVDTNVARVSTAGVVTGVSAGGPIELTATSDGMTGSAIVTVTPGPVATVIVEPDPATATVCQMLALSDTIKDASGDLLSGHVVTWTSADTTIAQVSAAGFATGVATGGPIALTASSEGKSGSTMMTVTPAPVSTVIVEPNTSAVAVGQLLALSDTLKSACGGVLTGRVVTWSSADTTIAKVSAAGIVTGVKTGGPIAIFATSEGKSASTALTVTSKPGSPNPVATVVVLPNPASVFVGQTLALSDTLKDASGNILTGRFVAWASSNTSIATVNLNTGVVTGIAPGGPIAISATSEGKDGSTMITVPAAVATVIVEPVSAALAGGRTLALSDTLKDVSGNILSGRRVAWTSADPRVATVNANTGLVTTVVPGGPIAITATSEGISGGMTLIVTGPVATVIVAPNPASVGLGQFGALSDTLKDASGNVLSGQSVTWSSADQTIATVSASGVVTGVGLGGPIAITATSGGQSGSTMLTVGAPVDTVIVKPDTARPFLNTTFALSDTLKDASGNILTGRLVAWTSSDTTIATVSSTGFVHALRVGGPITITATSEGRSGTATVIVRRRCGERRPPIC
jgi:uncharacterized protein YjdB